MMADLDLLRDINNNFGHLAGDAVLRGVADVFRERAAPLRHPRPLRRRGVLDPAARDGARAGARDRRADPPRGRGARFEVETSSEPIRATDLDRRRALPADGRDANELIHQADLAVYRAKLQGRNRVARRERRVDAARQADQRPRARVRAARRTAAPRRTPRVRCAPGRATRAPLRDRTPATRPRFFSLSFRLARSSRSSASSGIAAGVAGVAARHRATTCSAMLVVLVLVGAGQALALEVDERRDLGQRGRRARGRGALRPARRASRSPSRPSSSTGAPGATRCSHVLFNIGALTLASLAAAGVFAVAGDRPMALVAAGVAVAGAAYFPSTPGSARSRSRSRETRRGGASSGSASPGSCRTTSSTASSAR